MGEFVEQSLEDLIGCFEQLERTQLFDSTEVREIVAQCRNYEYKLRKQVKIPDDFVAYAEYLRKLISLIKKRRKRLNFWLKKNEIDRAIGNKAEVTLRRACERFTGQLYLWRSRLDLQKKLKMTHKLSQTYARMLQIHGSNPDLWLESIEWELLSNMNISSARSVAHQALRLHKDNPDLWTALFRIELINVQRLLERKKLLDTNEAPSDPSEHDQEAEDSILQLKLAKVVLDEALTNCDSFTIHHKFYSIAKQYPCAETMTNELKDTIYSAKFDYDENAWLWKIDNLACDINKEDDFEIDSTLAIKSKHTELLNLFKTAVSKCPSSKKLWRAYLDYYAQNYDGENAAQLAEWTQVVLSTPQQFILPADLLHLIRLTEDNYDLIETSLGIFPHDVDLWAAKLSMCIADGDSEPKIIRKMFNKALKMVPESSSADLWLIAFRWTVLTNPKYARSLIDAANCTDVQIKSELKGVYLRWLLANTSVDAESDHLDHLHQEFRSLAKDYPNTATFYQTYIDLCNELQHLSPTPTELSTHIEHAYELLCSELGETSSDVWLKYTEYLMEANPTKVKDVYNRAIQRLSSSSEFVQAYAARQMVL